MNVLEKIFELLNPSISSLIGDQWGKIKFKLSKSIIYAFIGCIILYSLSLYNTRGVIESLGILVSLSAFCFSGLLIISGSIDSLETKFPRAKRFSLFIFVVCTLAVLFIGLIILATEI